LELTDSNRKNIAFLEDRIKYNEKSLNELHQVIQTIVGNNSENKPVIEKLKEFAFDVSTNFSGSLIANAIWVALTSLAK